MSDHQDEFFRFKAKEISLQISKSIGWAAVGTLAVAGAIKVIQVWWQWVVWIGH